MPLRRRRDRVCGLVGIALAVIGPSAAALAQTSPAKKPRPVPSAAAPAAAPDIAPAPASDAPVMASESPTANVPVDTSSPADHSLPDFPPAVPPATASHEIAAQVPAADDPWYEAFDVRLFADAYFSWNYNSPKPQVGGNDVGRAFDSANGFSLAWAGIDISHRADPVGGALSLRFGPAARRYNSSCVGTCDASYGIENVKQAYASWRPGGEGGKFGVDFGKFDTIYGAEVAESQDNINYTRGVLYWLGQPAFHTGLRATFELTPAFALRALAVNGWNNTIDNNSGKSFGLQATARAARNDSHDWVSASLGYLGGPEQDDTSDVLCPAGTIFDASSPSGCSSSTQIGASRGTIDRATNNTKGLRHFIDLVLTSDPLDALHVVLNADFSVERQRDSLNSTHFSSHSWYGAMLGARYMVTSAFAVAARGELYRDKDGVTTGYVNDIKITDTTITTGTLTLDYSPTKNLILRLENRLDHSSKQIFKKDLRELAGNLFTTALGVVVTTN